MKKVVLLGDANARTGNKVVERVIQKFSEEVMNRNGEMLIEFCTHKELRINNTYFPHKYHMLVLGKLRMRDTPMKKPPRNKIEKFIVKSFSNDSMKNLFIENE